MPDVRTVESRTWRLAIVCAFAVTVLLAAGQTKTAYAKLQIHSIITSCTLAAGFDATQAVAMRKIADYESGDHVGSHSKRYFGLFQLSKAMVKGHPWRSPTWNTKRALIYIKHRYGTPTRAWRHIGKTGWY